MINTLKIYMQGQSAVYKRKNQKPIYPSIGFGYVQTYNLQMITLNYIYE